MLRRFGRPFGCTACKRMFSLRRLGRIGGCIAICNPLSARGRKAMTREGVLSLRQEGGDSWRGRVGIG